MKVIIFMFIYIHDKLIIVKKVYLLKNLNSLNIKY